MKLFLGFVGITTCAVVTQAVTKVTLYEHQDFKGKYSWFDDLDAFDYGYLDEHLDNMASSFKIDVGSCVEMYEDSPPGGGWFWTADRDFWSIGADMNDRISSARACGKQQHSLTCPEGTFVKAVEWGGDYLRSGVQLGCTEPGSKSPSTFLNLYPSLNPDQKLECTGLRGIEFQRDGSMEVQTGLSPKCQAGNNEGENKYCGENEAVIGINYELENRSNFLKSASLQCKEVENIAEICEPYDKLSTLMTCDATGAVDELKCTWNKKVGYGLKTGLSESERYSHSFYEEFGFDIGYAGFGLSTSFSMKLGENSTTGYDWTTTQDSTWVEEVTVTVEFVVRPGCKATIFEVIGECAFMAVYPYHFIREDTCNSLTVRSEERIPKMAPNGIYRSQVPPEVDRSFSSAAHAPAFGTGKIDPKIGARKMVQATAAKKL